MSAAFSIIDYGFATAFVKLTIELLLEEVGLAALEVTKKKT